ncbi:Taurine catabolism dioxygenase TauD, TfdA family [Enhydrobacter aerosaccus]|uniref:Taurine catabolism dioxygenase TauD, TfdA family n=1 Tax=Enhydrobacter aerosaccus TaxID=225324 RepID=A0A1T4LTF0_9HYPH|nr:TauD/TfdA family dioxygenase [Enhydrobacter aerosaccus]SJZ58010.1 Taurine catabolism dioxygenase TauD, TfdA family [Enhydrobacter aerosaccus]
MNNPNVALALESAPGPIGGRLAWKSADLAADPSWIHRLTGQEVAELEAAAAHSKTVVDNVLDLRKEHFPLPTLATKIKALRTDIMDRFGFGYLRGLPVHKYDRDTVMRIYWGLASHIGDVVPQNRNGHMIGHVIDIGTKVDDYNKRLTQTSAGLSFHSDSCDVVGLVCLHTAMTGGESALVSGIAVHDEMMRRAPDLCRALYQPVTVDRRGEVPEGKFPWMRIPVFMWQDGQFTGYAPLQEYLNSARRFDEAPKMTDQQWQAVELFFSICSEPEFAVKIPFEPGDFQFVHNHVVFHSRTSFEDWPDVAKKRHLMRIWISLPDGRELHPAIAERWVHIERGTVRGGVNIPNRKALTIPLEPLTPAFA